MLLQVFLNIWLLISVFFLVIQQLLVASSTFFMKETITAVNEHMYFLWPMLLYLLSLILPYIPGQLARMVLAKSGQQSLTRLYEQYISANYNQPIIWSNKDAKDNKTTVLAKEILDVGHKFIDYLFDLTALFLNVLCNCIAIVIWIDSGFLFGYLISLALCIIAILLQSRTRAKYAAALQEQRMRFTANLMQHWDNIVLGNKSSFLFWLQHHKKRFGNYTASYLFFTKFSCNYAVLISMVSFLPVLAILLYDVLIYSNDATKVLIIIGSIPRIFLILSYTESFINALSSYPAYATQIDRILLVMQRFPNDITTLEKRINFNNIRIQFNAANLSYNDMCQHIKNDNNGLYTITGANGSGKSSLLLWLKAELGEQAYYLPAQHNLFLAADNVTVSTGQKLVQAVGALQHDQSRVLLLDEWDANLDADNKKQISELLTLIAKDKAVVEVRHQT